MLCLYLEAPFATFRTFTAGSFRPTAEFITPSAAYGLLLNVAGIEMRDYRENLPMTVIRHDLPKYRLALGALSFPLIHTIYQQIHNYPVGNQGEENAPRTKGSKYNITPTRRAFLSDLKGYICLDASPEFETQVKDGLRGKSPRTYGIPFLGDNNFLISRLEPVNDYQPAYWYEQILSEQSEGMRNHATRLTVAVDREDMSRSRSALFAPTTEPRKSIPENAWVQVGY